MRTTAEHIALRGIFNNRVWIIQSVIVVNDAPDETALLLMPDARCTIPEGWFRRRQGDYSLGTRWQECKNDTWLSRDAPWQTNRLLMLLEPEKYYSIIFFWNQEKDKFLNYYVNFQLPYQRTQHGFDTLDLELDIVVEPDFSWYWKDKADYEDGIREGCIEKNWVEAIERDSHEVLERIEKRHYPFDGSWLNWRPDSAWAIPTLREEWKEI